MSAFTEKARKQAGISEMTPGSYPKEPNQRGCKFWAKYVTAADTLYEELREERDRLREEVKVGHAEHMKMVRENAKLKNDLAQSRVNVASREIRDEIPEFTSGHQSRLLEAIGR